MTRHGNQNTYGDGLVQTVVTIERSDGTEGVAATGYAATASQTPTITAGAYSAGDAVGGLLTFANMARASGGTIMVHTVIITDLADVKAALTLVLFDRTFTATSDNAAFDPSDADLLNIVGIVPFTASDYGDFNDNAAAVRGSLGIVATLNGTSLFGQLYLPAGSAPTYASTSDLTVKVSAVQLT